MSFGKDLSPQKNLVNDAIQYAEKKGVLLVHAAGNSYQLKMISAQGNTFTYTGSAPN